MILSRIDEQCLLNCSDPHPNICLQQVLRVSDTSKYSTTKKFWVGFLSARSELLHFEYFPLPLWKQLRAKGELLL